MHALSRLAQLLALAALAACSENNALAPQNDPAFKTAGQGARPVSVMSRNLYIGTDVDAAMAALGNADPNDDFDALMTALTTLQQTDFAARIQAIAGEIFTNRPDVVGLQEVYDLTVNLEMLGLGTGTLEVPFLGGLQQALAAAGLNYVVAGRNTTTDATIAGGAVHIVDHDVLLVNANTVKLTGAPRQKVFDANIGTVAEGITLLRGYVAQRALVNGAEILLVNTHLESGSDPQIAGLRALQASELARFVSGQPRVVMTGDFNDVPGSTMYQVLAGAEFVDTWAALHPGTDGSTCCQNADLSNAASALDQRIDFIWTRGFSRPSLPMDGTIQLLSADPSSRVQSVFGQLIWPSDHAGLVAALSLPVAATRN